MAEEPESGFLARLQTLGRSLLGAAPATNDAEVKDIWGPDWRAFMGIDSGGNGSIREITDQPGDYAIARMQEPYLWRALDVRGKSISQVPLKIFQRDESGRKNASTHEAMDVLKRTNALGYVDGVMTLMRYTLLSLDMFGRCAWKVAFDRKGRPSEVFWLPPGNFTPLHGYDRGNPKIPFWGIRQGQGNSAQDINAKDLIYFVTDNQADPIWGTSKISVVKNPINLRAYSQRSNMDFFRNSMRPDWLLSGAFRNTEENVERIRRAVRRHLSGESNRMPLIIGENMSAHLLTERHNDAEWIAQQRLAQEEISSVFGVPVVYLNNFEKATYDNIQTAKVLLWHDAMIPEGDILAENLTKRFLWKYWPETQAQNLEFAFDYAQIEGLGEDIAKIWERTREMRHQLTQEVLAGQVTANQSRRILSQIFAELGFDDTVLDGDVQGGDTRFIPYMNIPVEQSSVQAIIDIMAARGTNPQLEENVPGAPTIGDRADAFNPDRTPDADPTAPGVQPSPPRQTGPKPPQRTVTDDLGKDSGKGFDAEEFRKTLEEIRVALVTKTSTNRESPVDDKKAALLAQRMKRFYQDLQTEVLRNLREEKDYFYNRGTAVSRLQEILLECGEEAAGAEDLEAGIYEDLSRAA